MTDPVAEPDDVRIHVPTELDDDDLERQLAFAAREDARKNSRHREERPEDDTRDLEAAYAALRIATTAERRIQRTRLGSAEEWFYDIDIDQLRALVHQLDESGEMASSLLRDRDRYTGSATIGGDH